MCGAEGWLFRVLGFGFRCRTHSLERPRPALRDHPRHVAPLRSLHPLAPKHLERESESERVRGRVCVRERESLPTAKLAPPGCEAPGESHDFQLNRIAFRTGAVTNPGRFGTRSSSQVNSLMSEQVFKNLFYKVNSPTNLPT